MNIDILSRYFTICDQSDAIITYSVFKRKMRQFCGLKKQELTIDALKLFFAEFEGRVSFVNQGNKTRNIVHGEVVNTICIRGLKEHGPIEIVIAVQEALNKIPWKVLNDSVVLYSDFKRRVCETANVLLMTPNIREIILSCMPLEVDIKRKWHPMVKGQNLYICNVSCSSTFTEPKKNQDKTVPASEEQQTGITAASQDNVGEAEAQAQAQAPQPEIFEHDEKQNQLIQAFADKHLLVGPHLKCPLRLITNALIQFAELQSNNIKHKDAKDLIQLLPTVWITQNEIHRKYKGKYVMSKFVLGCDLR